LFRWVKKKNGMIRYKYIEQEKLLIIKFTGKFTHQSLAAFIEFLFPSIKNQMPEKILNDFRNAEFDFDVLDIDEIIGVRNKFTDGPGKLKAVHLVHDSTSTVYSTLFSRGVSGEKTYIQVCSTMEYAISLLGLSLSPSELEDQFQHLPEEYHNPGIRPGV
jgi:hypothetical protein